MFRTPFSLIMLALSLFSTQLAALEVEDLYQVSILVESQAREEREQAIKNALSGVFLKVGGKESVLSNAVLLKAKKRASRYVSQYRYQRKDDQLSIVVSFNENQVNAIFEQANLPIWGSLRPQVLLWLIDEQGFSRTIVASNADSLIPQSVNDFSVQRGLPILMPLMDLTDNDQVILSDFWAYFPEQIQQASLRYFADTIVVMRVSNSSLIVDETMENTDSAAIESNLEVNDESDLSGNAVEQENLNTLHALDWRVYTQGALYIQRYQGFDKVSLIEEGLSDITELIYQSYALSTTAEKDFIIEVENVTSLVDDTKLFNFLINLSAVKTVTLTQAVGNVRRFKLELIGSRASLLASLKLNNKLTQKIESQFDGLYQDDPLNDTQFDIDFNRATHQGIKVIILGENEAEKKDITINSVEGNSSNTPNETDTLKAENIENNALEQKELTKTLPTAVQDSLGNEKALEEIVTKPISNKINTLKITPNIPVFIWEQG